VRRHTAVGDKRHGARRGSGAPHFQIFEGDASLDELVRDRVKVGGGDGLEVLVELIAEDCARVSVSVCTLISKGAGRTFWLVLRRRFLRALSGLDVDPLELRLGCGGGSRHTKARASLILRAREYECTRNERAPWISTSV
jgi:hypothetical protein